jgi:hypothetical protein
MFTLTMDFRVCVRAVKDLKATTHGHNNLSIDRINSPIQSISH